MINNNSPGGPQANSTSAMDEVYATIDQMHKDSTRLLNLRVDQQKRAEDKPRLHQALEKFQDQHDLNDFVDRKFDHILLD
jgi:hypothetical protein